jgi:hypothetical protein
MTRPYHRDDFVIALAERLRELARSKKGNA